MLFNSFEFLFFLPLVWVAYWSLKGHLRLQNLLIVIASYVFYGWWDWRFLVLIAFTSGWSYVTGLIELGRWEARPSKALLTLSLLVNLGILGYFKYANFFLDSLGLSDVVVVNVILPVGISFYTFQALSYSIDVYRRKIRPTRDPLAFFAFISFFPQLVAGPIERAVDLLPQFQRMKSFDYPNAVLGCRQMLWGFFKKMVIADNCAVVANQYLNDPSNHNGFGLVIGIFFFSLQLYGDFGGYSDIAIGCSKLFGIELSTNFSYPYFSRTVGEFWQRWHMSLMRWFKDYLYIPLGGGRAGKWKKLRNVFVVFTVSGLWHGAAWNFVLWGVLTAVMFLPGLLGPRRSQPSGVVAEDRGLPTFGELFGMLRTFLVFLVGLLMFRSQGLVSFGRWCWDVVNVAGYRILSDFPHEARVALPMIGLLVVAEWFNRRERFGFARYPRWAWARWSLYYGLVVLIAFYSPGSQSFVYFQF